VTVSFLELAFLFLPEESGQALIEKEPASRQAGYFFGQTKK
jgi:hypothetical protein